MKRKKLLVTLISLLAIVVVVVGIIIFSEKRSSLTTLEKEGFSKILKDSPDRIVLYGFDEKTYEISDEKDIASIVEALKMVSYDSIEEEYYIEGLFPVDIIYADKTVSVNIGNEYIAYDGMQYRVENGTLDQAVEVITRYLDTQEEAETWKTPIEGLPEDFIFGMDASSLLVEENSGVKFYNEAGQEQDALKTFADAGINYVRLRVWNDPYDENGNGYGGGNNDLPTAIELGKRATEYGMKVCIDFHYSDFWADPKRQHAPKAWEGMSVEEKSSALYDFTKESLEQLLDAGVDVGMIQVGNEINYGMSGETKLENVITLLKAGSKAIREVSSDYGKDINIVVHYTRITDKADVLTLVSKLVENELDFDMIGMSYYPFWDGSMENMSRVLELIQERYGKQVFLAETSYAYTTRDGDGSGNSFKAGDAVDGYEVSVEGQATIIRDICKNVNDVGGLGIFYWEGAWIPVGPATADNSSIWEKYGSGWASSFASDYDPEDAGLYYGGCSWDNQAFFDFEGHPLESVSVFKYMRHGE